MGPATMMLSEGLPSLAGLDRAIAVIVVSELGDKTFLIAAILSMRYPRMTVFMGAFFALAVMSLLSSLMGTILPTLIPRRYTTVAAALLFFVFGYKMLQEGMAMSSDDSREKMEEEMREAEEEVKQAMEDEADAVEEGRRELTGRRRRTQDAKGLDKLKEGVNNLLHFFLSPVFVQAFVLTFLAEWGDRSQITTIALAAAHNVWLITFGTTLGHSFCTMLAVIGGRWISQHISIKHVTIGGAVLFLIFGLVYTYEAYAWDDAALEGLPAIAGTVADAAIQAAKQGDGLVGGGLDVALDNDA